MGRSPCGLRVRRIWVARVDPPGVSVEFFPVSLLLPPSVHEDRDAAFEDHLG